MPDTIMDTPPPAASLAFVETSIAPDRGDFYALVLAHDYRAMVDWLVASDDAESDLGNALFVAAKRAIADGQLAAARILIRYLLTGVEEADERESLILLLVDLYLVDGDYSQAREALRRLPWTSRTIEKYLSTHVDQVDFAGMLAAGASIRASVEDDLAALVDRLIDTVFAALAEHEEVVAGMRQQLDRNVALLATLEPRALAIFNQAGSSDLRPSGRLLRLPDGVFFKTPDGRWHRLPDEAVSVEALKERVKPLRYGEGILIIWRTPRCIQSYLEALPVSEPQFFKSLCYVVVDFDTLADFMAVFDLAPLSQSYFIYRFVDGRRLAEQVMETLPDQNAVLPNRMISKDRIDSGIWESRIAPVFDRLEQLLFTRIRQYQESFLSIYPAEFPRSLIARLEASEKLRIMVMTSRYTTFLQYCSRDLAAGFRELGHEVRVVMEGERDAVGIRRDRHMADLVDFRPDVVICINHFRHEYDWLPKNVPFITWIQDWMPNIFEVADPGLFDDFDFIYSTSSQRQLELMAKPAYQGREIRLLPYLLNTEIYHPLAGCEEKYQVSYVAHQEMPAPYLAACSELPDSALDQNALLHRRLVRFADRFSLAELNRLYTGGDNDRREFLARFFTSVGMSATLDDDTLYYFRHTMLFVLIRTRPVKALIDAGIKVALFGNGWQEHPWFAGSAMGPVANGEALNRVINETAINLNINPFISCHNKVPEVAGAGGFFLTRRIGADDLMPIEHFFEPDREVVLFEDEADLVAKVKHYLAHPEERREIAARARDKVLDQFTFAHGATRLLGDIRDRLLALTTEETR